MDLQERIAAYLFAALNDKRVNVLCLSKPDGEDLREVLKALSDEQTQLRFEYHDAAIAIAERQRGMRNLVQSIYKWEDARVWRSVFDDIFDNAKKRNLVRRNLQRNGFVNFLRSLPERELTRLLDQTYLTNYPPIGPARTLGQGTDLIAVYDNIGQAIEREGFDSWLRSTARDRTFRASTKMIIVGADVDFPKEIIGLGNWGYSVDLRVETSGGDTAERFSPVELDWHLDTLSAESRAKDPSFQSGLSGEALSQSQAALGSLAGQLLSLVGSEQVDRRLSIAIASYKADLDGPDRNFILLDCHFDIINEMMSQEEGVSGLLAGTFKAFSKRHRATISSSEICRELDRVSRLIDPKESIPDRILEGFVDELELAQQHEIVDASVREVAGEIAGLETDTPKSGPKKAVVLKGFIKAMWTALKHAPDAVKGVQAFQTLLEMAERLKEALSHSGYLH